MAKCNRAGMGFLNIFFCPKATSNIFLKRAFGLSVRFTFRPNLMFRMSFLMFFTKKPSPAMRSKPKMMLEMMLIRLLVFLWCYIGFVFLSEYRNIDISGRVQANVLQQQF